MNTHTIQSFHGKIHARPIWIDLRIVFDKDNFTESTAKETIKEQIKDLDDVYSKIKIHFELEYVPGTAKDFFVQGTEKYYTKISEGAKDGVINGYLYRDDKETRSYNYTNTGSRQFFLRVPNKAWNDPFNTGAISHELGHVFGIIGSATKTAVRLFGSLGNNIFTNGPDNLTADANINSTILWLRSGFAAYGRDWVDDYRKEPSQKVRVRGYRKDADDVRETQRDPTILDLYRAAAIDIAAQTKK